MWSLMKFQAVSCVLCIGNLHLSDKTWKFNTVPELCPLSSIPEQNTTFQKLVHLQVASLLFNAAATATILQRPWQTNEWVRSNGVLMQTGKNKYWENNLLWCHFNHHKSCMDWSGNEPTFQQQEADDYQPGPWHSITALTLAFPVRPS